MNESEQFAWEMEILEYNRLKRIYDEEVDGLRAVRIAMRNTVSEIHWFHIFRPSISVRRLLIKLHDRIAPWVVGGLSIDYLLPPEAAVVGM